MSKYISLSDYGSGNAQKNMRASGYNGSFAQSYHNYHKFMEYLKHLEEYKEEFKDKVPQFWGMRKNWFPLILLGAVKDGYPQAMELYNMFVRERGSHSFYYKGLQSAPEEPFGLGGGDYYLIEVSGMEAKEEYISAIMNFFGLKFYIHDNDDGLYADSGF